MKHTLYGDGIHDDTAAIQELIDSGIREVALPSPEKFYLISKSLVLPSNFRLVLPRFAEIKLAANSNCVMVKNKMIPDYAKRMDDDVYELPLTAHLWGYVDDYSPDAPCENIELCGGIWNCNNMEQIPNPEQSKNFSVREFYGCGMLFYNVKNFKICDLTVKDPSQYAITLDKVSYFTVEGITFDFNKGNPYPINMDGIHVDGNCHHGVIRNLKGTCYDDLVALNAHEGSRGDITNIDISDIYADYCHSAVRLLLVRQNISNIRISNIYGNFYQYCIGFTKFYPGETEGSFDAISIDNIFAAKALTSKMGEISFYKSAPMNSRRLIWIQKGTVVNSLSVSHWHRREKTLPQELICIDDGALVNRMILSDITAENCTDREMPLMCNMGTIKYLATADLCSGNGSVIVNKGIIEKHIER
ncbi:MAG: hypothetical protein IKA85_00310 [Clostridia bacterium]|nr:hypothetical protein [Clostridia bacterium]